MAHRVLIAMFFLGSFASMLLAQECKVKFGVGYTDGKQIQPGLTPEQKKYWDAEGNKKLKGMCLDLTKPDYVILWSVGVSGKELLQVGVANFNRNQDTGESTTATRQTYWSTVSTSDDRSLNAMTYVRDSSAVRAKADYWILDLSKSPAPIIRTGQGYRSVPAGMGVAASKGEKIDAQDLSSTIPDETVALENALKWLKKEKKNLRDFQNKLGLHVFGRRGCP
jgi:hypothetical protein